MTDLNVTSVEFIDPDDSEAGILVQFDRMVPPGFHQIQFPGRCLCGAMDRLVTQSTDGAYAAAVRLGAVAADDLFHLGFYIDAR